VDDETIRSLVRGWLWFAPLVLLGAAGWRWRAQMGRFLAALTARRPVESTESDGDRRAREAKAEYERALLRIDEAPMDDLERDSAKRQAKQAYLRKIDGVMR
jgi:hypothetical protein